MTTEPKPMPDLLSCPFKFIREYYPMTDTNFSNSQVVHLVMEAFKHTRAEPVNKQMLDALKNTLSVVPKNTDDLVLIKIRDEAEKAITAAEQQLEKESE